MAPRWGAVHFQTVRSTCQQRDSGPQYAVGPAGTPPRHASLTISYYGRLLLSAGFIGGWDYWPLGLLAAGITGGLNAWRSRSDSSESGALVLRSFPNWEQTTFPVGLANTTNNRNDNPMQVTLDQLAYARSGDKGDGSNVGVVANSPEIYDYLVETLTPERVKSHFAGICLGSVERFEAPNLLALNFLLHDSLGGGGSASMKTDAQGKTHGLGLLLMKLDAPDHLVSSR